jgi:hypothetical protein
MKTWKKVLLVLLVLVLLTQVPFAYRRYKRGRLNSAIQILNSQRKASKKSDGLLEYKGVVHVHSFLGGHSNGTLQEIVAAAQANGLNFVVMTEHPAKDFNTAEMTLKGEHGGLLFVNGNEVRAGNGDRLLLIPGDAESSSDAQKSTEQILSRRSTGLNVVAYPPEFKSWTATGYEGIEIYNVFSNAREINPVVMFFDALWSYRSYPDLLFLNFYRRPEESLKKWDELTSQQHKRLVATAGNDSHANVGISLNDASGKSVVGFRLDPYERSFRLVRMHVLVKSSLGQTVGSVLDEKTLEASISAGHCFIGFDILGESSGFRFVARDNDESRVMGDEIRLDNEVNLHVQLPVVARILLFKDGVQIQESKDTDQADFVTKERGVFRVEVYLSLLPAPAGDVPWIISNPIYVR